MGFGRLGLKGLGFSSLPAISSPTPTPSPTLNALTLAAASIAENASSGTTVGAIQSTTVGSTLSLTDSAGSRFAISGGNLVTGATALDYETATSHSITIRETLAGATNTPRDTTLSITVIDKDEVPNAFTFTDVTNGTVSTQYTSNTITVSGLDTGVTTPVSITGGTYSKNGAGYVSSAGSAVNGDQFSVQQTSSASNSANTDTTLTIGGVSDTYRVSTEAAVPITAIAAAGYIATYNGTPPSLQPGTTFALTRKGYDGSYTSPSGVPTPTLLTNITETISVRNRVRAGYPDDSSEPVWHATNVALSTYPYSTDSASGVTNSSAEASPKPTCAWAVTDRRVVGNLINLQVVAFHRNARNRQQVPCVVFSATDGTTTVYALVAASSILSHVGGSHPFADIRCEGFEADIDITSLSNNADITVNASVYPWIGDSSSVAVSNSANEYEFAPLVFRKNTSKAANPPLAYVASTGTDATVDANGVSGGNTKISTNAVTAKANAFATINSALAALKAATTITGGFTDGCELRLVDGASWGGGVSALTYTQTAALTITRDPLSANRAAAPLTLTASTNSRHGHLRFSDIKFIRGANVNLTVTVSKLIFENVDYDAGSFGTPPGGTALHYWVGVSISNCVSGIWTASSTPHNLIRGCSIASGTTNRPEAGVCIGNKLSGASLPQSSTTRQVNRMIVAFNKFTSVSVGGSTSLWGGLVGTYFNSAITQNLFEYVGGVSQSIVHASADSATESLQGLIFTDNTMVGAFNAGRVNFLYDETIGTYRNHKLACVKRNVFVTLTIKSDYFIGVTGGANGAESVQHTGNHNVLYGVDLEENFHLWPDAAAVGFGTDSLQRRWANYCAYTEGSRSSKPNGAAGFVEFLNDAKFKDFQATTYAPAGTPVAGTYTAGAGGGDYRAKRTASGDAVNSPLLGQVLSPAFRFGLDGTARASSNDTIGAYA